jgi:hypothetical protein
MSWRLEQTECSDEGRRRNAPMEGTGSMLNRRASTERTVQLECTHGRCHGQRNAPTEGAVGKGQRNAPTEGIAGLRRLSSSPQPGAVAELRGRYLRHGGAGW